MYACIYTSANLVRQEEPHADRHRPTRKRPPPQARRDVGASFLVSVALRLLRHQCAERAQRLREPRLRSRPTPANESNAPPAPRRRPASSRSSRGASGERRGRRRGPCAATPSSPGSRRRCVRAAAQARCSRRRCARAPTNAPRVKRVKSQFAGPRQRDARRPVIAAREVGAQASATSAWPRLLAFPLLALLAFLIFRGVASLLPIAVGATSVFGAFAVLRAVNVALPLSVVRAEPRDRARPRPRRSTTACSWSRASARSWAQARDRRER